MALRDKSKNQAVEFVLGALAVGVITLAREWFLERKRWARDDESYRRATRVARRLVADELDSAQNHVGMILRHDEWPVADVAERANFLPSSEWHKHKERLAEALDDDRTWAALAGFYYSLDHLRLLIIDYPEKPLTDDDRKRLRRMHDQAMALHGVLLGEAMLPEDWQSQLEALRESGKLPPAGERA